MDPTVNTANKVTDTDATQGVVAATFPKAFILGFRARRSRPNGEDWLYLNNRLMTKHTDRMTQEQVLRAWLTNSFRGFRVHDEKR